MAIWSDPGTFSDISGPEPDPGTRSDFTDPIPVPSLNIHPSHVHWQLPIGNQPISPSWALVGKNPCFFTKSQSPMGGLRLENCQSPKFHHKDRTSLGGVVLDLVFVLVASFAP